MNPPDEVLLDDPDGGTPRANDGPGSLAEMPLGDADSRPLGEVPPRPADVFTPPGVIPSGVNEVGVNVDGVDRFDELSVFGVLNEVGVVRPGVLGFGVVVSSVDGMLLDSDGSEIGRAHV